jgi:pimeloyl-ACP methyl ester carboxylesterase
MKQIIILIVALFFLSSCNKEEINISNNVSDHFYVKNGQNSSMVRVRGNAASKIFLLYIHGGPGGDGLCYQNKYVIDNIESRYAAVYYDQRNAGASQGAYNQEELTLDNMIDDVEKLIAVLKHRYGNDIQIFMLAHSFGGLLSSGFMTTDDNQQLLKGWIYVDGAHDYAMNDSLTRSRLLVLGNEQIAQGNKVEEWKEIVDYCNAHPSNFDFKESMKYNQMVWKAMGYLEDKTSIESNDDNDAVLQMILDDKIPVTAYTLNIQANYRFMKKIIKAGYSNDLYKVTIPTIVIYGKKDLVCPSELGEALYSSISSSDKEFVLSDISKHSPMDDDRENFYNHVIRFIEAHKE